MVITLVGDSLKTTDAMRSFVHQRLSAALDRFRERIARVEVRVRDENGPRGGIDKRCRVTAIMPGAGPLLIEKRAGDFYEVIARATNALKQNVARRVSKRGKWAGSGTAQAGALKFAGGAEAPRPHALSAARTP